TLLFGPTGFAQLRFWHAEGRGRGRRSYCAACGALVSASPGCAQRRLEAAVLRSCCWLGKTPTLGIEDQGAVLLEERSSRHTIEQIEHGFARAAEADAFRGRDEWPIDENRMREHGFEQLIVADVRRKQAEFGGR